MEQFTVLKKDELLEIDGGVAKFAAEVAKDLLKWVVVDTVYEKAIKPAVKELTSPSHYEGKEDYRTWLN